MAIDVKEIIDDIILKISQNTTDIIQFNGVELLNSLNKFSDFIDAFSKIFFQLFIQSRKSLTKGINTLLDDWKIDKRFDPFLDLLDHFNDSVNNFFKNLDYFVILKQPVMEFYKSITKRSRNVKNIDIDHSKQFTENLQSKSKNAASNSLDDVNNSE